MKKVLICFLAWGFLISVGSGSAGAGSPQEARKTCDLSKTSICTIEMWLAFKQKPHKKEIWNFLKSKSIKVLPHTVQFWRPKGGHPPTNIAIGHGLSAEDARMVIELAEKYNDRVEMLVLQSLNPANYAAIATSAWDEKSQIPITQEELEKLKDPSLSTQEFHTLYRQLTDEENLPERFY
ncbi:MAG: hypothetical protein GWM98_14135 [Nitrospinaceae bacterium]|nr:hypothetical protein [Nitrospinaceae bacterium]NIR55409.1 hypothetical protein [Nitrospinaceae bacterium]NIS85849.1 hypothetical protein [Nitrospinaceae bacterium]NIT82693.1 hypothetical protein [Nitrospinaceae bacterium]NIU44905.1 hypothetical protein [Nitrospinaceae bacterium]